MGTNETRYFYIFIHRLAFNEVQLSKCKIVYFQAKAKAEGLWNLFLPVESDPGQKFGAGLSNVEYAFLCEEMGKCPISSEVG